MPSLLTILILGGVLVLSIALTVLIMRRTRPHGNGVPDETLEEARALRERVDTLYTGSDDIQRRAKRLEQMLEVQRRGKR